MLPAVVANRKFNWINFIGIVSFHLMAIAAIFTFSWQGLIAFIILSAVTGCLGITLGYHRLLSHRSFETPAFVKYIFAFIGCLALQGGPVNWVATHRLHHKEADRTNDPHSSEEGFWWCHLIWNFFIPEELNTYDKLKRIAPDIHKDPVLRFMDQYGFFLTMGVAVIVFAVSTWLHSWQIGLSIFVWGFVLRTVYVWHATWLVNSATHYWGYQTYPSRDKSRNNWWVALLTYGEGWHNNHHVYPRSARMGLQWFELDITYMVISFLRRIGLANKVMGVPA